MDILPTFKMSQLLNKNCLLYSCLLSFLALLAVADAAQIDYSVSMGATADSNVLRQADPVGMEYSSAFKGSVVGIENTGDLIVSFAAGSISRNYLNNIQKDYNQLTLNARAIWLIKPNHYEWFASDTFAQTITDPFAVNLPSNRKDINVTSTGPNIILKFSLRDILRIEPRIESYNNENDLFDNNRQKVAINWLHGLSVGANIQFNSEVVAVDYWQDGSVSRDYKRSDMGLLYQYIKGANNLSLGAGLTRIDRDTADPASYVNYGLLYKSQRTKTSTFSFESSRKVTDTNRLIQNNTVNKLILSNDINDTLITNSTDVFVRDMIKVIYTNKYVFSDFQFSAYRTDENYQIQKNFDRQIELMSIKNSWNPMRASQLTLTVTGKHLEYVNIAPFRKDREFLVSVNYRYNRLKHIAYLAKFESYRRDSSIDENSFDDVRLMMSVEYKTR